LKIGNKESDMSGHCRIWRVYVC